MTVPQDPAEGDRGHIRAGHDDREQVIETLKDAFAAGRLTKDELGTRAGQALIARTRADLTALTADLPPATAVPAAARTAGPPATRRRRPLARAATGSGLCLLLAAAALRVSFYFDPDGTGPHPDQSMARPFVIIAVVAVITALGIVMAGIASWASQRYSRRQLPPRPRTAVCWLAAAAETPMRRASSVVVQSLPMAPSAAARVRPTKAASALMLVGLPAQVQMAAGSRIAQKTSRGMASS